jgi:uncharacterized membrane protein YhaH (DUF805 family)
VRRDYWWGALLGFLLLVLNVYLIFEPYLAKTFGWSLIPTPLSSYNFFLVLLLYFLLIFLGFLLVGFVRAHVTGKSATRLSVTTGLVGILPMIVLLIVLGVAHGLFQGSMQGMLITAYGLSLVPIIGGLQILVGIGGAIVGGSVKSRFQHRPLS